MKYSLKQKAIRMRQNGWSYNDIHRKLKISKSTLSGWLKAIPFIPNSVVTKRIKQGPAKSIAVRSQRRIELITIIKAKSQSELGKLSARDLWMLGIGIYIGEGTKSYEDVRIINSDVNVIKIAINWFIKVCGVPKENFSLRLHIYPDISDKEAKQYWSAATGIPALQFSKTQIDLRANK
ncbi:helix-turn-helix domain-containing protein [Patescibacteria group bacterium]|nr:helix-turn-helix domain-containing protein [Patescibacteria group bacterium]